MFDSFLSPSVPSVAANAQRGNMGAVAGDILKSKMQNIDFPFFSGLGIK